MSDLDLARRAVACKGWRWLEGMSAMRPRSGAPDDAGDCRRMTAPARESDMAGWLPDLTDPATRGALLQLAREAWNAPNGYVTCKRSRCASQDYAPGAWDWTWAFWGDEETFVASGDSEVSALIVALEAAPERK